MEYYNRREQCNVPLRVICRCKKHFEKVSYTISYIWMAIRYEWINQRWSYSASNLVLRSKIQWMYVLFVVEKSSVVWTMGPLQGPGVCICSNILNSWLSSNYWHMKITTIPLQKSSVRIPIHIYSSLEWWSTIYRNKLDIAWYTRFSTCFFMIIILKNSNMYGV